MTFFSSFSSFLSFTRKRCYFKPTVYTEKLNVIRPSRNSIPIFRILDPIKTLSSSSSELSNQIRDSGITIPDKRILLKMYTDMLKLNIMDSILYEAQRQGRISFYMTCLGEEASTVCSAAALHPQDWVFGQYREAGVLMWRGFSYSDFINQCLGNKLDLGKGRQMPVHYGSRDLNFMTISSPLATQIPQAAGMAYGEKYIHNKHDRVVICYFGEGAASEGDFHAGVNIAAVLKVPLIFYCRNNEWAISTHHLEQYAGDGIAIRGSSYGIPAIRVDGNDPLAIFEATRKAREIAIEESIPVIVEAMTFRLGHHSTSDDSTAYRSKAEMDEHSKNHPLKRFREFLSFTFKDDKEKETKGEEEEELWPLEKEKEFIERERKIIIQTLKECETIKKPSIKEMFTDVYENMPWNLVDQFEELKENIKKYPHGYPTLDKFESAPFPDSQNQ